MTTKKNSQVGGHKIDLLLTCGCIVVEDCEAAIYAPNEGEERYCHKHQSMQKISKVGSMYWLDEEQK